MGTINGFTGLNLERELHEISLLIEFPKIQHDLKGSNKWDWAFFLVRYQSLSDLFELPSNVDSGKSRIVYECEFHDVEGPFYLKVGPFSVTQLKVQ